MIKKICNIVFIEDYIQDKSYKLIRYCKQLLHQVIAYVMFYNSYIFIQVFPRINISTEYGGTYTLVARQVSFTPPPVD